MDKSKLTEVERDLVEGLGEFLDDLKTEAALSAKYNCRRVALDLEPHCYSAAEVKVVREMLQASQALFAKFLGVSPKTVRAWEQGKAPSDMARRFMDEIRRNPDYWRKRVEESATVRTR